MSWMLDQGNRAHADRQSSCDVREFQLNSGRADCLIASGETCTVVEFKPDSRRAINNGDAQGERYSSVLNAELSDQGSSYIKKLIDADSDVAKCKRFESRVDCYTLRPTVNDDGEFREVSASWRKDCT